MKLANGRSGAVEVVGERRVRTRERERPRRRRAEVAIDRPREIGAVHEQVGDGEARITLELPFDGGVGLHQPRVGEVLVDIEDARPRRGAERRNLAERSGIGRDRVAGERQRDDVDAVVRVGGAEHDRRRPPVEESPPAAHGEPAVGRTPGDAQPRAPVVGVGVEPARVDIGGRELRVRIPHRRRVRLHEVVAQPEVEREVASRPPLVLGEDRVLLEVGMGLGSGRAGPLEVLLVELVGAVRPAAGKRRERAERVRPAEEAGEVVQDVVELKIEAALELVLAANPRRRIRELPALDRRLARAEVVAADRQDRRAGLLNDAFGIGAVGEARLPGRGPAGT